MKWQSVGWSVTKKLVHPKFFSRALFSSGTAPHERSRDDRELFLYSQLLGSNYLHYGYFPDPHTAPEDISLSTVRQAQQDYAEKLLQHLRPENAPVLDIGCGMGGVLDLLHQRHIEAIGLTPDQRQTHYIRHHLPQLRVIESKFEDIDTGIHAEAFGALLCSESFQYLNVPRALRVATEITRPGARWVICDYFRKGAAFEHSGHHWKNFQTSLKETPWRLVHEENITPHILPLLRYLDMWGKRLVLPFCDYLSARIKRKQPKTFYLLENFLVDVEQRLKQKLQVVDPDVFARDKDYLLLVLERD